MDSIWVGIGIAVFYLGGWLLPSRSELAQGQWLHNRLEGLTFVYTLAIVGVIMLMIVLAAGHG